MSALPDLLDGRLRRATSVGSACRAVVDSLAEAGLELPSLYLARGGRLRCVAVRGYWQVFDGMPPSVGVIGAVYRTGAAREVREVGSDGAYLAACLDAVDEVCVPVVVRGVVVGVVNVESTTGLPADALEVVAAAGDALARRLDELGGVPAESAPQRLARVVADLVDVPEFDALWAATCEGARDVAGCGSAVLVLADDDGGHLVAAAVGTVGREVASACPPEVLAQVGAWVASGSSCWTADDPGGRGFPGSAGLRTAGAAGVVVVALGRSGPSDTSAGYLLVADEQVVDLATDVVELLELLAAHVTSCARTLDSLAVLRRQAERDPLTDLRHHGAYQRALAEALGDASPRRSVATLLLDVDNFKAVNDAYGHPGGDALLRSASRVLSRGLRDGEELYRVGGDEFAALLSVGDAQEALGVAERLCALAREDLATTVSVGVAVAEPGEPATSLVARTDAALYASKREGRDRVTLAPPAAVRQPAVASADHCWAAA